MNANDITGLNLGTATIAVLALMVLLSVGLGGVAASDHTTVIEDGDRVEEGQVAVYEDYDTADEGTELELIDSDDNVIDTYTVDADGQLSVDTGVDAITPGAYDLQEVGAAEPELSFTVTEADRGSNAVFVDDGDRLWKGQVATYDASSTGNDLPADGTVVELYDTAGDKDVFVGEYVVENDSVTIDTDTLDSTSYTLEETNGTAVFSFNLTTQNLSVSVDDPVVNNSETDSSETTLNFSSNRASYESFVYVAGFDEDDYQNVFGMTAVENDDGDDVVRVSGKTVPVDFQEVDAGEYDLEVDVVDSSASDEVTVTVQDPGDASATFDSAGYQGAIGDEIEMTLNTSNAQEVDLVFGDEDSGYEYEVTVRVNDDDNVDLVFDTHVAGQGDNVFYVDDENSDAEIVTQSETIPGDGLSEPLDSETYTLEAQIDGDTTSLASVSVGDRTTMSAVSWTAPANEQIEELEDVAEFATEDSTIALEDHFIVEVNINGVFSVIDDDTVAADFDRDTGDLANNYGLSLRVVEQNPGVNKSATHLDVSNADFYADEDNDSLYFVFDSDALALEDDDTYKADFRVDENSRYVEAEEDSDEDPTEKVETSFDFEERIVEFDTVENEEGDDVIMAPANADAELAGTTNVAEGTEFTSRVLAVGIVNTDPITVEGDSFVATHDLSSLDEGDEFTAQITGETGDFNGVVSESGYNITVNVADEDGDALDASVTLNDTTVETEDGSATVPSVPSGDYTLEVSADGYDTDTQEITVDSNQTVDVTLSETMPQVTFNVEDTNGNAINGAEVSFDGDTQSFTVDGQRTVELANGNYFVTVSADGYDSATDSVTVDGDSEFSFTLEEEESQTDDGQTDDGQTDDGQTDDGQTDENGDDDDTDDSTPGFGAVVALVALVAAALLAVHRRD